jgi:CheY-like chemotaxis protein
MMGTRVERHGGDVATKSERAGAALRGDGEGRRVLVVDDNGDAAELLAELLMSAGHEVAVAHDGEEALAVATRFQPDVAVLDIGLPHMDGYEVARRLRADPARARLRLIAVTGYGQAHDRARSFAAGFELHMVKPVDFSALLAALG